MTESALHVDVRFEDGATVLLHIPLGRNSRERQVIEDLFAILLRSWAKAYHPHPCPLCQGTGDAANLPTMEELFRDSAPVQNLEDAVAADFPVAGALATKGAEPMLPPSPAEIGPQNGAGEAGEPDGKPGRLD